jgi:cell division septum initiation protein DivIVA
MDVQRELTDRTAVHDSLVQENVRLLEELEKHQGITVRVDKLEQENQRLTAVLKTSIDRCNDLERTANGVNGESTNAIQTGQDSSVLLAEHRQSSESVSSAKYNHLSTKYNILHQNWLDMRDARDKIEQALRIEKGKMREWNLWADSVDKKKSKTQQRIQQLEDEVQRLRQKVESRAGTAAPPNSSRISNQNAAKEHAVSCQIQIPNSPGRPSPMGTDIQTIDSSSHERSRGVRFESNPLPELLDFEAYPSASVDDTQFDSIEPHHSRCACLSKPQVSLKLNCKFANSSQALLKMIANILSILINNLLSNQKIPRICRS